MVMIYEVRAQEVLALVLLEGSPYFKGLIVSF